MLHRPLQPRLNPASRFETQRDYEVGSWKCENYPCTIRHDGARRALRHSGLGEYDDAVLARRSVRRTDDRGRRSEGEKGSTPPGCNLVQPALTRVDCQMVA